MASAPKQGIPPPPTKRVNQGLRTLMRSMKVGEYIELDTEAEFNSCGVHAAKLKKWNEGRWQLSKPQMKCWRIE